jgi:hypothetical protein
MLRVAQVTYTPLKQLDAFCDVRVRTAVVDHRDPHICGKVSIAGGKGGGKVLVAAVGRYHHL